jgi:2-oxo-4-hydroxy-4-carboxy-5-ureidoimidazoline decarboxylase
MTLSDLNALPRDQAVIEFRRCCGTKVWAEKVADLRPFSGKEELFRRAREIWNSLGEKEWREAFAHHPRIGGAEELRKKFSDTSAWASEEQSGVRSAGEDVIASLAEGNRKYEARYGHIFLVCASGKSAKEMLAILESRMNNSPEKELIIAADEQAKITQIRLEKMIS